ncbi:S-methyl-5-thioribose-1-phosphate isomerase [bacterium]|nr:S-methyl-5-thioribose-1-phosphate isomerase [bacterium]MBU1754122.1 S-methyl-5-thioribose-1-phosphate isomerase [bacterium]
MIPEHIIWTGDFLRLLDQTRLPEEIAYLDCKTPHDVAAAIKRLSVRGAPAIGVAAAYGVILGMDNLNETIKLLASTRPTAVNLFWALERMKECINQHQGMNIDQLRQILIKEACLIHEDDKEKCKRIGAFGASLINDGDGILTHCNAGALATGGIGTALGVIYTAIEQGKKIRVYADETRPLLQGSRLTAWELKAAGVDVTLICDNMAGVVMREGRINLVVVGADRITSNGDVANKIGTYSVAVLAEKHNIPFFVAAPTSTIDMSLSDGSMIPIEQRAEEEITCGFGRQTAPDNIKVYNPAFDVTPHELIKGIITETGIAEAPYEKSIEVMMHLHRS